MRVLLFLLALGACAQRTSIRHAGEEIGEDGQVRLRTGEVRDVRLVGYIPTGIVVDDGYQQWQVPYQNLDSLEYHSHAAGAWQGFKWGGGIGVVLGVLWGIAVSSATDEGDFLDEPGEAAAFGGIVFGFTGILFGTPIGAIKGKTTEYATDER
jgi:hypothetical protein